MEMMNLNDFFKHLYEHLITKRKYNKLLIKYETAIQDRRKVEAQYEVKKDIFEIRQREWEKILKEQELEIIELKRRRIKNDSNSKKKEQEDN